MKKISKILLSLFATFILMSFTSTVNAGSITSVNTSQRNGYIIVSGEASNDVLAVAIMIYDKNNKIVSYETTGVKANHKFSTLIEIPEDTYTVKVADYKGGDYRSVEATKPITSGDSEESSDITDVLYDAINDNGSPLTANVTQGQTFELENVNSGNISGDIKLEVLNDYNFAEENEDMIDTTLKTEEVPAVTVAGDIAAAAAKIGETGLASGAEVKESAVFNIDLILLAVDEDGNETEIAKITEVGSGVTVTLDIPEDLKNTDPTINRTYKVVRLHNGVYEMIPNAVYNPTTGKITFRNDKFSKFIITAVDTKKSSDEEEEDGIRIKQGYTYLRLYWDEDEDYKGYKVYRKVGSKGTWYLVKTYTNSSTTTYKDTNVITGKKYYYRVRPYKVVKGKTKFGEYSETVSAYTKRPGKSTISLNSAKKTKIVLDIDKGENATGVEIFRATSKNGNYYLYKRTTKTTYTNTGLTSGKNYYYKVRSYKKSNGQRIYSKFSEAIKVKTSK